MNNQIEILEPGTPSPETQPARKHGVLYAIPVVAVAAFLAFLGWGLMHSLKGQVSKGTAPDFSLTSFDGKSIILSKLRGQVVIINFWASWCPPCREEAPYLEQTWRKYQDKGVVFIGVDYADTEKEASAYLKEYDITYFNGPDLGTRISQSYNMKGVPETYYVDKQGQLRGVKVGPLVAPELDQKIEELLSEP
jgi:cytochrome c biogenesis protein CcmG/thiol:disulfide interchange protein DsbE